MVADSGAYSFAIPAQAPVKAVYSAAAASAAVAVPFAAESTAAGKYTLEALVLNKTAQTAAIDVISADAVTPFSFAP